MVYIFLSLSLSLLLPYISAGDSFLAADVYVRHCVRTYLAYLFTRASECTRWRFRMTSPCSLHSYAYVVCWYDRIIHSMRKSWSRDSRWHLSWPRQTQDVLAGRLSPLHNAFAINYPGIYSGNPRQKPTSVVLTRRRALCWSGIDAKCALPGFNRHYELR